MLQRNTLPLTIALAFTAGCSQSTVDTSEPTELASIDQPVAVSLASADPANTLPVAEVSEATELLPIDDSQPIPEHLNFFAQPQQPPRAEPMQEEEKPESSIKLLGFLTLDPSDPKTRLALLKTEGQILQIAAGEYAGDVELVSIDGRSVTLERDGELWTIDMLAQPIVNAADAVSAPSRQSRRSRRSSTASIQQPEAIPVPEGLPMPQPPPEPPGAAPMLPPEPKMPELPDMNADIKLPDLSELGLPDIELPDFGGLLGR